MYNYRVWGWGRAQHQPPPGSECAPHSFTETLSIHTTVLVQKIILLSSKIELEGYYNNEDYILP